MSGSLSYGLIGGSFNAHFCHFRTVVHSLSQHDLRGVSSFVFLPIRCGQQFLLFFLGSWPGRTVSGGNVDLWLIRGSEHSSIGSGVGGLGGVGAQYVCAG